MLSTVTGPFHPDLEHALVAEVHSHKRDDPLRPLAIVVPPQQIARRVKWLLSVEEGRLRTDDPARLAALVRLCAAVLEVDRALHLADPDDLAALAMERVADSAFLKRMARVCYFGLYDLTQGQLDFFKAVAGAYPT